MNPLVLATVDLSNPLLWAVLVAWIISVTLHEFAHGLVAWAGGDYTVRERGGLTLNPLHYANPLMTFILPLIFVLIGGIPLVGAATYIRQDLLRNRAWRTATSLAGPLTNLLLFLLCAIPLHPRIGWVDLSADNATWPTIQLFCGAMATLQLFAVFINLLPIPPLDGYRAVEPYLPRQWSNALSNPQAWMGLMFGLFLLLSWSGAGQFIFIAVAQCLRIIGFDDRSIEFVFHGYYVCLFGAQ